MPRPRVLVLGLDCAPPSLAFARFADAMPHLSALRARGVWGPLRSVVPPVTVPAWACMTTGRDPGELGIYGFRDRVPGTYDLALVDARRLEAPRVWDLAASVGLRTSALFVPPSWPPRAPAGGEVAGCFLTPSAGHAWSDPPALKDELTARFGAYQLDVEGFRGGEPARLAREIRAMTEQHLAMALHVWEAHAPDLLFAVTIGPDRFHHALWEHLEPAHPRHDPAHPLVQAGRDYYAAIDAGLGALLARCDAATTVLVVSDHGARTLHGGVAINEWLIGRGELVLHERPAQRGPLAKARVDWSRTRAWGEGGYHGRVFFNVRGREPQGVVAPEDVPRLRAELVEALAAMRGEEGAPLGNRVVVPAEAYRATRGNPPDLLVFFGDLDQRALGTIAGTNELDAAGRAPLFHAGNDTGADAANHDWDGIFAMAGAGVDARGYTEGLSLYDVTPTVLARLGVAVPDGLLGRDVAQDATTHAAEIA